MDRRHFLGGVVAATLGAAGLVSLSPPPDAGGPSGPRENGRFSDVSPAERRRRRFVNVALRTHEGKEVRFYDDLIKDKTILLNFFYTNCVGEAICPMATANLVKVQRLLGKRVGRDIFMYSITLDPEHDTPRVLKRYADGFGAGPGWLFLTGGKAEVDALRRNLGDVDPDPVVDAEKSTHTGMLRFGIERLERWAGCAALTRPGWIVKLLARIEPRGERRSA